MPAVCLPARGSLERLVCSSCSTISSLSVIKNIPIKERLRLQFRADIFNLSNRINLASGAGSVAVGGNASPNFNTCAEDLTLHHCTSVGGFGMVSDTIGDFNGAPGLGPGEEFNMQLVIKLIF